MPFGVGGRKSFGWSEPPVLQQKSPPLHHHHHRAPLAERNYDTLGDEAIPSSPFGNMNAALREKNRGRTKAAVDLRRRRRRRTTRTTRTTALFLLREEEEGL